MIRPLTLVDVFAEERYAGNQLAVIRHAAGLSGEEMLRITREMNYSESTFILSDEQRDGGYDVRIFTPGREVPFAGHPTLGTAAVIAAEIVGGPVEQITLNLGVGPITVRFPEGPEGVLWMRQRFPTFGRTLEREQVAETLGLDVGDIDERWPVQEVSTGLPFIIAPLTSIDAVTRAAVNLEALGRLITGGEADAILVFAPQAQNPANDIHARVFVHLHGIPEDPATGSANGCLAGYLSRYGCLGAERVEVRVEQGYEIHRPSLLYLKSWPEAEGIAVEVGGRVIPVARGELL